DEAASLADEEPAVPSGDVAGDADDEPEDADDEAPAANGGGDAVPVEASFEDAFKAELETVHGDLGVAAPANRGGGGGGRRRRR
ncbi:MAG: hypothetical protein CL442_04045, partial [Acidimicrobiaceae bacterium]|nr:hypothetical protein [Acidimicrobiaceae bacterium]